MTLADKTLTFNASDDSRGVDVGTVQSVGLGADFTIECWVKLADTTDRDIIGIGTKTVLGMFAVTTTTGTKTYLRCGLVGTLDVPTPLVASTWYHLALRYTKILTRAPATYEYESAIYLNGILVVARRETTAYAPSSTARVRLGTTDTSAASARFNGSITEVRFWNVARTEAEIRADMFRHLEGKEGSHLGAYFPLDGLAGDTVTAARDAKLDLDPTTLQPVASTRTAGTITGATFDVSDLPLHRSVNGALLATCVVARFDGKTSRITVPDASSLSLGGSFTVEAWVRPTGQNGPVYMFPVVSKHSAGKGWELRAGNGQAGFLVTIGGVYQEIRVPLENGAWYLISGVFSDGLLQFYVNGMRVESKPIPSGVCVQSPSELLIGANAYWTANKYAGQIAEVRIWNEARPLESLHQGWVSKSRVGEGAVPKTLVALYRLQADAQDANVQTRIKNDGTASGVFWSVASPPLPPSSTAVLTAAASDDPDVYATQNAAQITANAALQASLATEQAEHKKAKDKVIEIQQAIGERTQQIMQLKATEQQLASREQTFAARTTRKAQLVAERNDLLNPPPILLTDFMQKATNEVKLAHDTLAAEGSKLRLDEVDLSVRLVPVIRPDGGMEMRFPKLDELKTLSSGNLSVLDVGLEAPEPVNEAAADVIVPSVYRYTETVARRKLGAAGLRVEIAYQAVRVVNGQATDKNRVVTQVPTPGTAVPKGSAVTLFIGRES